MIDDGVGLPEGKLMDGAGRQPWMSDQPVDEPADLWLRSTGQPGLQPVFAWPQLGSAAWSLDRVEALDLDAELRRMWRVQQALHASYEDPDDVELFPPFDDWPGLAPGVGGGSGGVEETAVAVLRDLRWDLEGCHLLLVPAERNADVPVAVGWDPEADVELVCGLLRSWDTRFGTRVVALQGARMRVSVARPPADTAHATRVAVEHFLTGTDTMREFTPFTEYAAGLVGKHVWEFWWD